MSQSHESILVIHVDTDEAFVDRATASLEQYDDRIEVEHASRPREGLDTFDRENVDCVVAEYDLPDQDGVRLLEHLRESDPHLPVILCTAEWNGLIAERAISAGVTAVIRKDVDRNYDELLARQVVEAVDDARAQRAHRDHLRAIDTAQEGISIISEDGTFSYVNQSYADLYGYEPAEMVGERFEITYPEGELDAIQGDTFRAIEQQGYWHGETMGLRADGTTFVEDHKLVMTSEGDLICNVRHKSQGGIERDSIEGLHSAVQALMEADSVDQAADITVEATRKVVDIPRIVVYRHEGNGRLSPVAWTEDAAGTIEPIDDPSDPAWTVFASGRRQVYEDLHRVEDHPRGDTPLRTEILLPLGEFGILQLGSTEANAFNETAIALSQTLAAHAATAIRGVQSKQQLREEREFIDQAVETLNDVFYVIDTDGYLQRWNDRLHEVTRNDLDIDGGEIVMCFVEEDREKVEGAFADAIKVGEATFEANLVTGKDESLPYEFASARLTDRDGNITGIVGIGRDISTRRQRERQLEAQNDRLDEFASIVSHDLRNPLNVAQGRLELASQECESDHLDDIGRAHDRMESLIEDLLTLSREGDRAEEQEAVDLAKAFEQCWQHVDTLDATFHPVANHRIQANPSRLKQLFENLIRNAIEHGGDDVSVTLGDREDGFFVADDGPGIPEDVEGAIFEPGYSTLDTGTGFGLAIVKQVANAHGWDIVVSASGDGGARFDITGVEFAEEYAP